MNDLEKMRSGRWLHAVTPEIGAALLRAEELCFRLNQLPPSRREEREAIIRQLFAHVGEAPCLHSPFHTATSGSRSPWATTSSGTSTSRSSTRRP